MRPPVKALFMPRSFGQMGGFGLIPILALTKLAAVRHRNFFPFNSAYQINIIRKEQQQIQKVVHARIRLSYPNSAHSSIAL